MLLVDPFILYADVCENTNMMYGVSVSVYKVDCVTAM
jgi:hypothetical protein